MFRFITRTQYRKEMALVILLKVIGLIVLWMLCCSHNEEKPMTAEKMAEHLVRE